MESALIGENRMFGKVNIGTVEKDPNFLSY